MQEDEYHRLDRLEESVWWFSGLQGNVLTLLNRHSGSPAFRLLDAGCGTGGTLKAIMDRFPAAEVHGLDFAETACTFARRKTGADIRCGSVNRMPWPDSSFDVILSLDVLGSDGVEPALAVAEFRRVLRPGGLLILHLPAYQWMLSWHDSAVGQSRRFTLGEAGRLFAGSGLQSLQGTYWNTFLFPLMVLRRKVFPARGQGSDVQAFSRPVNGVCRAIMRAERWLIEQGVRLPFGGSVLAVARKET